MCETGVNVEQLRLSIIQSEEALGMAQEWLERLHHLADRGKHGLASAQMAQVTVILGEARAKLEKAIVSLEGIEPGGGVTVELM
jgi:hypothetical protein